jgi:hypothetical protein
MAELIAIVGRSGYGKSTSIEGLDPKETLVISVSGKALPFKGWKKKYITLNADGSVGNYWKTNKVQVNPKDPKDDKQPGIIEVLNLVNTVRKDIKNVVIDD